MIMDETAANQWFMGLITRLMLVSAFAWGTWTLHRIFQAKEFALQEEEELKALLTPLSPLEAQQMEDQIRSALESRQRTALENVYNAFGGHALFKQHQLTTQ